MVLWLLNVDFAATEAGLGPVGPGATGSSMLLFIGRIVVLGTAIWQSFNIFCA